MHHEHIPQQHLLFREKQFQFQHISIVKLVTISAHIVSRGVDVHEVHLVLPNQQLHRTTHIDTYQDQQTLGCSRLEEL